MKRRWSWRWAPLRIQLTIADVMADLDPGWDSWRPVVLNRQQVHA